MVQLSAAQNSVLQITEKNMQVISFRLILPLSFALLTVMDIKSVQKEIFLKSKECLFACVSASNTVYIRNGTQQTSHIPHQDTTLWVMSWFWGTSCSPKLRAASLRSTAQVHPAIKASARLTLFERGRTTKRKHFPLPLGARSSYTTAPGALE